MPAFTNAPELIYHINNGWMSVNNNATDRLYISEKHVLVKHFEGRDPSSYTDAEKRFMASQEAQDLQAWYDRYGHIIISERASGNNPIKWPKH